MNKPIQAQSKLQKNTIKCPICSGNRKKVGTMYQGTLAAVCGYCASVYIYKLRGNARMFRTKPMPDLVESEQVEPEQVKVAA